MTETSEAFITYTKITIDDLPEKPPQKRRKLDRDVMNMPSCENILMYCEKNKNIKNDANLTISYVLRKYYDYNVHTLKWF